MPNVPIDLLEPPDRVVDTSPVVSRLTELPFERLSWQNFEKLVFRLVLKEADVEYCARYGRSGQRQEGVDVYGRLKGGRYTCWQARNRKAMSATDIASAVKDFLDGEWSPKSERFVLSTRAGLADTQLQTAIETCADQLRKKSIVFEVLDGVQLTERVRSHPDIIDDFFGRPWLVAFAGEDAAATLGRRLDANRILTLRARLAEIYQARFSHVDPGISLDPGRASDSDLRDRFVLPDVEPADPFEESVIEREAPPDPGPDDDRQWNFQEDAESWLPTYRASPPSHPPAKPSVPLDEWLLGNERSLLVFGSPGSGKSTILRCLALDLVQTPKLFPNVLERIGQRLPLLIPFALWTRLAAKQEREVGIAEVIRETFGAFVPADELQDTFIEALSDKRLLLLIDGVDEYSDEQAARTTLATIESFVRTHDVYTVLTARPAGLRRLGPITGFWTTARLAELTRPQQRDLASRLLAPQDAADGPGALRVEQFFDQLEAAGRLQTLAGNPLLLYGLLSVAVRQIILPKTRFLLFQQLTDILLDVHPNRRATAASEVRSAARMFATDDVRRGALCKLAFDVQLRGTDAGIDRNDARSIIEDFLRDPEGPGWTRDKARLAARELVNVDAETSGLLVESGPNEIAFCHSAFREHLAGLELESWPLSQQADFVSSRADEPRWRAAIITLVQSFNRRTDVERILSSIQGPTEHASISVDRQLLLADCAFAAGPLCGTIGRQVSLAALDRVETSTNEAERRELLGLALDGPRAGPIGEEIVRRLRTWWPNIVHWQDSLYTQLGRWEPSARLARTLERALHADDCQISAATGLATAFAGDPEVRNRLETLIRTSTDPSVTAAALHAVSQGWPNTRGLDDWLHAAQRSPSVHLRSVAALALYGLGQRGDATKHSLLHALSAVWSRFRSSLQPEIVDALVTHWAHDEEIQNACWEAIGHRSPREYDVGPDTARLILMRIHEHDPRVAPWIQHQVQSEEPLMFGVMADDIALLEPVLAAQPAIKDALNSRFGEGKASALDYRAAQMAAILKTPTAKRAMLKQLDESEHYPSWPVWSLLKGWGMGDPEVANALGPLARASPETRQHIAHHIPAIVGSPVESYSRLMEICHLSSVSRPDFLITGFSALDDVDDAAVVTAVLPHVETPRHFASGQDALIGRFHADPRVRHLAIQTLRAPSPPLPLIAMVYAKDREIASLVLDRAAPLPTVLRRYIAQRASQRLDDEPLTRVLDESDLETDTHAMCQATIGLSLAALASPSRADTRVEELGTQLCSIGPAMDERRSAAFAGLVALGRMDVFAAATEENNEPLKVGLVSILNDFTPAVAIAAEHWDELEDLIGTTELVERLTHWGGGTAGFWRTFAPHVRRSSRLESAFLTYCGDPSAELSAPALSALSQLRPRSSLLLDSCVRVLVGAGGRQTADALETAHSAVLASKCLATNFADDQAAIAALVAACEHPRGSGGALVGLASRWPEHDIVVQEWQTLSKQPPWSNLLSCAQAWLLSAHAPVDRFVASLARFATRGQPSPWDFAEEVLAAFQARLERDPEVRSGVLQLAQNRDEPSIRTSSVRLLATVSPKQVRSLADEFLSTELDRTGPPRFALDLLTNRIRPARDLLREAVRSAPD